MIWSGNYRKSLKCYNYRSNDKSNQKYSDDTVNRVVHQQNNCQLFFIAWNWIILFADLQSFLYSWDHKNTLICFGQAMRVLSSRRWTGRASNWRKLNCIRASEHTQVVLHLGQNFWSKIAFRISWYIFSDQHPIGDSYYIAWFPRINLKCQMNNNCTKTVYTNKVFKRCQNNWRVSHK